MAMNCSISTPWRQSRSELPAACSYYTTNLSTKRNVGLLLSRMVGWRRIFFLDDDIRDIGYPDLQSTVSMLARYRTAGMRVTEFPDNSAACHAHRATRGAQDVFLSGAALAVDMQHDIGFFPDIYNEDWLFFYDDVASGQIGSSARKITQLRYEPFADPRRAAWQEVRRYPSGRPIRAARSRPGIGARQLRILE